MHIILFSPKYFGTYDNLFLQQVCHVIEFEMGKSTGDRNIIILYDLQYIHKGESGLAYNVKTEFIGNMHGNSQNGAPAFIWTILLKR